MGWDYVVTRYHGVIIDARKTGRAVVDVLLSRWQLSYATSTNLPLAHILLYDISREIKWEHGTYGNPPDTAGDAFTPPSHPVYIRYGVQPLDNCAQKDTTDPKWVAALKECTAITEAPVWIEIAEVG